MEPFSALNLFKLRETHLEPFQFSETGITITNGYRYPFHPLDTYTVHTQTIGSLMLYFFVLNVSLSSCWFTQVVCLESSKLFLQVL